MIVKVQVPLSSSHPRPRNTCLIYASGRRHITEQVVDDDVLRAIGNDLKGYFEAEWSGTEWIITGSHRVTDEAW
jgi:hypothetical protein